MEIGIIWMTSLRILLVQVLSLWILDKTQGRESCRFVGEGEAEPQPLDLGCSGGTQVGFTCSAPGLGQQDLAARTGLGRIWGQSRAWDQWDIRDTRAGVSPLRSR